MYTAQQVAATAAKPAPTGKQQSQSVADATCSNCVAITYDDGPGELTAQLLDTLKADEVLDLVAYLLSRGDRNDPMFKTGGTPSASR